VTGTVGVLDLASPAGLLHLHDAFGRLQKTNFRHPRSLLGNATGGREKPSKRKD